MYRVRISTPSRTIFAAPYWIAQHLGYFSDEGIEASLEIVGDSKAIKDQLRAGRHDLSIDTPGSVILDALSGGPLRVIAGNARRPPLFVIASSHIRSLAQLRGAKFGVLSLDEGSAKLIPTIADVAGLTMQDFQIFEVGGAPARAQLLLSGEIDVGLQPMPLSFAAEDAGLSNLGWTGDWEPDWQFTTINASIEWTRRESDAAIASLRAMRRAMAAMESGADVASIVAPELSCTVEHASKSLRATVRLGILDSQLELSTPGLAKVLANLEADGRLPNGRLADFESFVDPTFLRQA
jgi:ABC-type nitrate/sulfonate/bicarbonate transport system substrate-binding protein